MGCKQSLNIKRHSYLQDTEGRPIEKIFDETILINTLPKYVVEFFQLYSYHRLKYIKGEFKDIFMDETKVYTIEIISSNEFLRRQKLKTMLPEANVAFASEMFYLCGCCVCVMDRYDIDLFEYLKSTYIHLDDFVKQICFVLQSLHDNGIFVQDLKPENIFVNTDVKGIPTFFIADIEYAFIKSDFDHPSYIKNRQWVRTLQFQPNVGRPSTFLEAIRVDLYSLALIIGRIETFYTNELKLNIFMKRRKRILQRSWDDRHKIPQDCKYAKFCGDFIVEKLFYKNEIINFMKNLLEMSQQ